MTEDVWGVLHQQDWSTLGWTYLFGAMWGIGGLTFGLTMRYLGLSLGMGVALGYCAAFGTLVPPIAKSIRPTLPIDTPTLAEIAATTPGKVTLFGVAICLAGIAVGALAGLAKEREMPEAQKKEAIKEFNFGKGILVATFSGIMRRLLRFRIRRPRRRSPHPQLQPAPPHSGSVCPNWLSFCWAGLRPTLSGVRCSTSRTAPVTNTSPANSANRRTTAVTRRSSKP